MIAYELPLQPTVFVGRTHELAEIIRLLDNPDCRLLTLVGPGGMGKTRLSLEAATVIRNRPNVTTTGTATKAPFSNGVYFVPLQPLNSPEFLVSALAEAVGLQFYSGDEPKQQLIDYLRPKALLLILDNFEHLLNGVDLVTELLANAPMIKMLITSRETLNIQEEWVYQVEGMHFPEREDVADPESYSAVQLFIQNARRVRPDFSLSADKRPVLRICRLVEGMPLALEMTAAWLRRLPADEIAQQIERGLDIFENPVRNVPSRHRSIRAVFEHSWNLLMTQERDVFSKLSVFRGGFRREAAEAVAGATLGLLSALVDKSLLHVDSSGRYNLHELLRQYAEEKLNELPGANEQAHDDHCTYYMDFLAQRDEAVMVHMTSTVMEEIATELKNIRLAVEWTFETRDIEVYESPLSCLALFYQFRCLYQEGEEVTARIVAKLRNQTQSHILIRAMLMQGWFVELWSQDYQKATTILEQCLQLGRELDDVYLIENALLRLSDVQTQLGSYERARVLAQESVDYVRGFGDQWHLTFSLAHLGYVKFLLGDYSEAKTLLQEAVQIAQENDVPTGVADAQNYLGQVEMALQSYQDAKQAFTENLAYSRHAAYLKGEVMALIGAGEAALKLGEYQESRQYFSEALKTAMKSNQIPYVLHGLAATAELLMQTNARQIALDTLAVVLDNQAASHETRSHAQRLFNELSVQLSPETVAAALECAKCCQMEKVVQDLLDSELSEQPGSRHELPSAAPSGPLTERELEILRLLANGLSNREIAEQLFLATGTVKWYLGEIYGKLYVRSRTQAIVRARELNLIT